MFNVGAGEMLAIMLLALIVLGPDRLPKAMGQLGRTVAQLRRMSGGFQDEIRRAMDPDNAPFRPGEETLPRPVPAIEDEVKVVNDGTAAEADAPKDAATGPGQPKRRSDAPAAGTGGSDDDPGHGDLRAAG